MSSQKELEIAERGESSAAAELGIGIGGSCPDLSSSSNNNKNDKLRDDRNKNGSSTVNNSVPFYKLFVFADYLDMVFMIVGTVGAIVSGMSYPVLTVLFGKFANSFGRITDVHALVDKVSQVCVQFIYVGVVAAVASFCEVACWTATGERQAARIRSLYLRRILQQEIAFFDKEMSTGAMIESMSGDTVLVQDAMGEKVGKFIELMTILLGGFVVSFVQGWKLTLVLMSIFPLFIIVGGSAAVINSKLARMGQLAYAEAGNVVEQTTRTIRTVAAFTGERKSVAEYDKSLETAYRAVIKEGFAMGLTLGLTLLVSFCSYGLCAWYGSVLIINEEYSGGKVITIMFAVLGGSRALGDASPCLTAFTAGQAAAYKMFSVIYRKPAIDIFDTKGLVLQDIKGDIEIRNIYFSYPARPDVQIFSGFSLEIFSGTTAALVGESGSGKSTVISLLQRYYDPQDGEVLIDGTNLKQFQLRWIRQKVGLVGQEPVLFGTTIKENIAYGKINAKLEEIQAASEIANAAKFISNMPQGYETLVGEHGTQLSGGQKQRIAIARAILKDPRILLLDEATSALDVESERVVQEALERVMKDRTTVVVAHRLSTIKNADLIAVVHKGSIVEKGTHSQLVMNPNGAYSHLIRHQEMNAAEKSLKDPDELDICYNDPMKIDRHQSHIISEYQGHIINRASTNARKSHFLSDSFVLTDQNKNFQENAQAQSQSSHAKSLQHKWKFCSKCNTEGDIEGGEFKPLKGVSIFRLASLNKPEAPILLLGSLAAIVSGILFPVLGLLVSAIIYVFYEPEHKQRKDVSFWALMFVALAVACFIAVPIRLSCFAVAGGRLIRRLRSLAFQNIVHQEIGWFDYNSSGVISARLSTDAANVRSMTGDALSLLVQNLATIVGGIVIAFTANWQLALLILALLPIMILQSWVQFKFLMGIGTNPKVMYEEASKVASDAVGSIRTVASFCAEEKVTNLYKEKCRLSLKSGIRQGIIGGIGIGFSNFIVFAIHALSFWIGALLVRDRKTTFSKVFRVFFSLSMSAVGISRTIALTPDISKVKMSVASVFQMVDRKSNIDPADTSGMTLNNLKGDIEFRSVKFKYPTRPEMQIFQNLCLRVNSGQTIALIGESGSGKSTVVSLVERFYDPDSGQILLDGVDIRNLQVKWLRQQIGLVSQEPALFNGTIGKNITYGKDGIVSDEEIRAAAEASNAHKFISALPEGYDTQVGERGIQLSGGQKQRIAIARAILKNPRVLLLDEATSSLDAESENIVQEALERIRVTRSTIIIAHRLSTIKNVDVIVVLQNGVVVEQGHHEELINKIDGAYAALIKLHTVSS